MTRLRFLHAPRDVGELGADPPDPAGRAAPARAGPARSDHRPRPAPRRRVRRDRDRPPAADVRRQARGFRKRGRRHRRLRGGRGRLRLLPGVAASDPAADRRGGEVPRNRRPLPLGPGPGPAGDARSDGPAEPGLRRQPQRRRDRRVDPVDETAVRRRPLRGLLQPGLLEARRRRLLPPFPERRQGRGGEGAENLEEPGVDAQGRRRRARAGRRPAAGRGVGDVCRARPAGPDPRRRPPRHSSSRSTGTTSAGCSSTATRTGRSTGRSSPAASRFWTSGTG